MTRCWSHWRNGCVHACAPATCRRYGARNSQSLLPQTDVDNAYSLAEDLSWHRGRNRCAWTTATALDLTVSIGVAALPANDQRPARIAGEALLQAADGAVGTRRNARAGTGPYARTIRCSRNEADFARAVRTGPHKIGIL